MSRRAFSAFSTHAWRAAMLAAAPLLASNGTHAQTTELLPKILPMSGTLGFEKVKLPGGERMGLVGASIVYEVSDGWWVGPAAYGAGTGLRGGLFVGGLEVQRRWMLGDNIGLIAGMYAGGGGGGAAPVGGGLMLRPALSIMTRLGGGFQGGLSLSEVRFPSGDIRSHQLGVLLAWNGDYRYYDASQAGAQVSASAEPSGIGFNRLVGSVSAYQYRDAGNKRIGLLSARAERTDASGSWHLGLEASAAGQGGAAGYMELLGTAAYDFAPFPSALPGMRLGARAALGLGGGGGVPTGGGVLAKGMLTAGWQIAPRWQVGVEAGLGRGTHGHPNSRIAQVWLATTLEPQSGRRPAAGSGTTVVRMDWVGTVHHMTGALRRDGTRRPMELVGIKLNRELGDHLYISAQAHSAFAGGAGAYSVGLLGAGVSTPYTKKGWRAGVEVLVGAAGGGGVATNGGAIVQTLGWAGWSTGGGGQLRIGVGGVRAARGSALSSPLIEVGWSHSYGLHGR